MKSKNASAPASSKRSAAPADERRSGKYQRILAAAIEVIAEHGFFGAKVSEIARRAGVADGTIYLYFRNKEDILVSLFDEVMSEHLEKARRELATAVGAPARLEVFARHHLRTLG